MRNGSSRREPFLLQLTGDQVRSPEELPAAGEDLLEVEVSLRKRHQIIHFWMFLCRWKSKFKTESSLARLIALVVFHQVTRSDKFVAFGTEGVRVYKGLQTNISLGSYI